jgi:hypothetical protein
LGDYVDSPAKGTYVIALLSPRLGEREIGAYLRHVYAITCLNLVEQAATFRRKQPMALPDVHQASDVHLYIVESETISAHRSTLLEIGEAGSGSWVRYQPDAYTNWKLDPNTGKAYATNRFVPGERTLAKLDLTFNRLLPTTTDGRPPYAARAKPSRNGED